MILSSCCGIGRLWLRVGCRSFFGRMSRNGSLYGFRDGRVDGSLFGTIWGLVLCRAGLVLCPRQGTTVNCLWLGSVCLCIVIGFVCRFLFA